MTIFSGKSSVSTLLCLVAKSCLTLLRTHGLQSIRLHCPWEFSGKNTGRGCHFLLQGIILTQGSNPCLLHHRWNLYNWATWEVPCVYIKVYKNGRKHRNKNIINGFLLHALIQCLLNPYFVAGIVVNIGL